MNGAAATAWAERVATATVASEAHEGIDLVAAEEAATALLVALGIDVTNESTRQTPGRMARAYAELLSPDPFEMTTFPNDEETHELVVVQSIEFTSLCEHHMLPFSGVAHVGYVPQDEILGLSKFARMVAHIARRPQTQERLTAQVAKELHHRLRARGVGVVMHAEHACMSLRGARSRTASTRTSTLLGELRDDATLRAEFLALTTDSGRYR